MQQPGKLQLLSAPNPVPGAMQRFTSSATLAMRPDSPVTKAPVLGGLSEDEDDGLEDDASDYSRGDLQVSGSCGVEGNTVCHA
jgi:hypothetical protein